ncbi:MAG: glycogen debranching protein GlgX [Aquabacterium sp.]|nr:glycogen debranching protein GlgX [Aquabacterium sp.]
MDRLNPAPLVLDAGRPWPLGVHWDGQGLNIAVASTSAHAIALCLFDADGRRETHRGSLPGHTLDVWHGYLRADAGSTLGHPGQLYGLRAHGPWRPDRGHRFNRAKLLLDPYARQIVGSFDWGPEHFGHDGDHPLQPDPRDNAATALKARVVHDDFNWGDDRPPHTPLADSVLCELHVKGFTALHPGVPAPLRGTYAGLAQPAVLRHLQGLGITAVSLLPVHHWLDELRLVGMGLTNYWGYNTLGFFCPAPQLAADPAHARHEFRSMVKALHAAGIEVLLDVVFNHTAESDERGPTLSWRGLDNTGSYRLPTEQRAAYDNYSGCGNTLDMRQPAVLRLVLDSLRFWVQDMHVDGFRFDLATALGRGHSGFEREGPFFQAIAQDPVLAPLLAAGKLIAEPWDLGPGGYQAGNFPRGWLEWNDSFRDTVRAFWLGGAVTRGQFAQALAGSSQRLQSRRRGPSESVNYVVSHDGFTLRDLVSHDLRHNEANGEHNRDGHGHNLSWNCGIEGATDDPAVLRLRSRLQRALLATLLLSQGTPMLAAGDEIGHSQGGNNNPYCQDNTTTWIAWPQADAALRDFTARLLALRRQWLPLRPEWYTGLADARGLHDLSWLRRGGDALNDWDWTQSASRVLGAYIGAPGRGNQPLLLLFNAEPADTRFTLPPGAWQPLLDTADDGVGPDTAAPHSGHMLLRGRSVALLAGPAASVPPPRTSA